MLSIVDIRTKTHELLKEAFQDQDSKQQYIPAKMPEEAPLEAIEAAGFMRRQDAEAIKDVCRSKGLLVSFRTAGVDTLNRIKEGHPCKGHEIMDKSIKRSKGAWTYLPPQSHTEFGAGEESLEALKGLVGSPSKPNEIHPLKELYLLPAPTMVAGKYAPGCSYTKAPVQQLTAGSLQTAYTGDYDMHDLIKGKTRLIATTPEEHAAIDELNSALLKKDDKRTANYTKYPGRFGRSFNSPYALIRHGAQTSYLCFLTSAKGYPELKAELDHIKSEIEKNATAFLPFEKSVVKIDDNIVVFLPSGKAYILKGVKQVYQFYVAAGLIDQIPFYNFFNALRDVVFSKDNAEKQASLNAYVTYMLTILGVDRNQQKVHPWQRW